MMGEKMLRVSRRTPCPVCGKRDWCGISSDGSVCICMRVPDGALEQTRNGGWLHRLRETNHAPRSHRVRRVRVQPPEELWVDFGRLAAEFSAAVDIVELQDFAEQLGLSVEGLVRLGIGWSVEHRAWSFPMRDAGKKVRGIRLRSWAGRKLAVRGSRDGLFIPSDLVFSDRLLIAEGVTDTAALLDLGFAAAGRPSCSDGVRLLVRLVKRAKPKEVVIVADGDANGVAR